MRRNQEWATLTAKRVTGSAQSLDAPISVAEMWHMIQEQAQSEVHTCSLYQDSGSRKTQELILTSTEVGIEETEDLAFFI